MSLTLSWDLFVVVFFALVIAYSFIIGKDETTKIIVASYIAALAVQAVGNVLERATVLMGPVMGVPPLAPELAWLAVAKTVLFLLAVILLAVRGGIAVDAPESGSVLSIALTGLFGFTTAGMLTATLLAFVADRPLLDAAMLTAAPVAGIIQQSVVMEVIAANQDLWFSLPALLLLLLGFFGKDAK